MESKVIIIRPCLFFAKGDRIPLQKFREYFTEKSIESLSKDEFIRLEGYSKPIENTYTVTPELITPLWKRVLRFFKLMEKRVEFELVLWTDVFEVGDLIETGPDYTLKIIKK